MTRDLGTAAILVRLPRTVRAPLVYESHGYAPDVARALPEMVTTARPPGAARLGRLAKREAAVWRAAEGYATITAGLAHALEEKFGPRPLVKIVPDGVKSIAASQWEPLPDAEPPVVGYAGHLYPWKGVDVLLAAIARTPHIEGLIIGGHEAEGDRGRLESLAVELGISERMTFAGHVAPAHVADLLRRATVLALPNPPSAISTHFTSPLKLFEYMAMGRPIVASDLPAIREVLEHETNALLVRAGDAGALADGIRRVIADRELAARIARRAFGDAASYTWERRAQRLEVLFEEVRATR